jgi:hypothetical protein
MKRRWAGRDLLSPTQPLIFSRESPVGYCGMMRDKLAHLRAMISAQSF